MDRRTDGGNYNIRFAFLKKRADKKIKNSLLYFLGNS